MKRYNTEKLQPKKSATRNEFNMNRVQHETTRENVQHEKCTTQKMCNLKRMQHEKSATRKK